MLCRVDEDDAAAVAASYRYKQLYYAKAEGPKHNPATMEVDLFTFCVGLTTAGHLLLHPLPWVPLLGSDSNGADEQEELALRTSPRVPRA